MSIDRSTYIGGSDAAAILGVSKYKTPLQCYLQKIGEAKPEEIDAQREKIFRRGKRLEPIVIDMLEEEYGIKIVKRSPPEAPNRYTHPLYPWAKAEIDFEFLVTPEIVETCGGLIDPALIGTVQNGEVKTTHPLAAHLWGEELTEDVPIEYAGQSMHGLMVTDRKFCLYGTLVGSDDLLLYGVRRDQETIDGLLARELAFWNCVQTRTPPDPINMGDVLGLMYKVNGRPVEATGAIADTVAAFKNVKAAIKSAEDEAERLKFEIAAFIFANLQAMQRTNPKVSLEDATALIYGGKTLLTWKMQEARRVDVEALKAADLYMDYSKVTASRVMRTK